MIRVLRLLEYTYEDNARADEDMARWMVPPVGSRRHENMTIRSAIITEFNYKAPPEPDTN